MAPSATSEALGNSQSRKPIEKKQIPYRKSGKNPNLRSGASGSQFHCTLNYKIRPKTP